MKIHITKFCLFKTTQIMKKRMVLQTQKIIGFGQVIQNVITVVA